MAAYRVCVAQMRGWDVLVAPHGGQNANFGFISRCTVVLELFPPDYYTPMYLQLALQAGAASAFQVLGSQQLGAGRRLAHPAARKAKLATPASFVMKLLPMMLREQRRCFAASIRLPTVP